MPFVTYTNATCLISSTWNRPILMNLKYKCFLGALSASILLSGSQICVGVGLPSLRQWLLSGGENLFSLTSEEKREPSHGFPSLPGCEAPIALGVAQLGVAVSFPSCPEPLRSSMARLLCVAHRSPQQSARSETQRHSVGKLLQLELVSFCLSRQLAFLYSDSNCRLQWCNEIGCSFAERGWPRCSYAAVDVESSDAFQRGSLSFHGFDGSLSLHGCDGWAPNRNKMGGQVCNSFNKKRGGKKKDKGKNLLQLLAWVWKSVSSVWQPEACCAVIKVHFSGNPCRRLFYPA